MPFVIDASVSMAWCFEDESTPATDDVLDRLQDDFAVVPTVWPLEVANVLLVAERRGRLSQAQAARFLTLLSRLPIRSDTAATDLASVHATGRQTGLSAYDASYLVLAERSALPLATLDGQLASACRDAGVELILAQ